MLEGVAPESDFEDSFLLFKMLFGALVLFLGCFVLFLGCFVLFLGGFVLFFGCFEDETCTFLLGLEPAL